MAQEPKTLEDLFLDALKDTYFAEKKILSALPNMAKTAENEDLAAAFEKHRGETEEHVTRLEEVFELMDEPANGKKCPAILGIIEEGEEIIGECYDLHEAFALSLKPAKSSEALKERLMAMVRERRSA